MGTTALPKRFPSSSESFPWLPSAHFPDTTARALSLARPLEGLRPICFHPVVSCALYRFCSVPVPRPNGINEGGAGTPGEPS